MEQGDFFFHICPRSGHLNAWPSHRRSKNSAAPTLRWAAEWSQRDHCYQKEKRRPLPDAF